MGLMKCMKVAVGLLANRFQLPRYNGVSHAFRRLKAKAVAGCPLIASAIQLVELLCEILSIRVEEIPVEYKRLQYRMYQHNEGAKGEFVPMFYSNQEFLGVSI